MQDSKEAVQIKKKGVMSTLKLLYIAIVLNEHGKKGGAASFPPLLGETLICTYLFHGVYVLLSG